jgi:3',5'-cyclic AMP phosphodiesterase CpdA
MRILHLSDLHFGYEDGEAIAAVYSYVQSHRPDLIVASGDLSAAGLQSELSACADWLASLGPPVIATPGNHDVPYFEVLPRFYRPFRRFRRAARGRMLSEWRSNDVWIVTINTARAWQLRLNWALGSIARAQVWRAMQVLAKAPRDALKIIVTHHPLIWPIDPALPGGTHGGHGAVRNLIGAGAHLFLAGHLHVMRDTAETEAGREALLITGGTLCTRLRGDPQGFNVIEVNGDVLTLERHGLVGGVTTLLNTRLMSFKNGRLCLPSSAQENAAGEPAALPA